MDARHKLVSVWVAVLACLLLWGVRPIIRAGDGLAAQYYDHPTWTRTLPMIHYSMAHGFGMKSCSKSRTA
jgi:hypothetical protein